MKKFSFFAVLTSLFAAVPVIAGAAYPVYQNYQGTQGTNYQPQYQQANNTYRPQYQQVINQGNLPYKQTANTSASRVTGTLPNVGAANSIAGRQYYQAQDYDRLADSGLYIGISIGYSSALTGGMNADYTNETNASYVPGSFKESDFKTDTVIPIQLSVGAAINNDVRVDFSYTRYTGIEYADNPMSSNGADGFVKTKATGGAITSNATMLNLYYNVDSYTGNLAGGSMRPYIGAGVGIAMNTIADYVILDNTFYSALDPAVAEPGQLTGISDIYSYHNGGTSEQLAYMLEGGITTELEGGIKLDFFVRYSGLGKVRSSGSIVVSQTEWLGDGAGDEYEANYDSVFHYTNWQESGTLSSVDLGLRLRLQF